jgi:hypothetical protein
VPDHCDLIGCLGAAEAPSQKAAAPQESKEPARPALWLLPLLLVGDDLIVSIGRPAGPNVATDGGIVALDAERGQRLSIRLPRRVQALGLLEVLHRLLGLRPPVTVGA